MPPYRELRTELEREAGSINSGFAEPDWTPLRIVARAGARNTMAGYMREARVGLVTPLRDGMNLVAKEYVAAQDPRDPGVLVLSRFAGAARQLDAALLVNPHDADEMADALDPALTMNLAERQARWRRVGRDQGHLARSAGAAPSSPRCCAPCWSPTNPASRPRLRAERSAEGISMVRRTPPVPASPTPRQIN